MSLVSHFEQKEHVLLIRLVGELDHHEAGTLKVDWEHYLNAGGIQHVIVNLEDLTFMDSSGLGVFLGRYKQVKALGGEMVVCAIQKPVKRLFELSGLFKVIQTEATEIDALSRLGVAS
ncbi:stage II sporulation protein AA (anti-sigma F factor antagonist) [Alkalibacillus flavidus]|uniref:Anti-sigma F factor antagonist n=1 Tax=Alkalibacillus flavidus TaxID=546021 RepID=A0ABV2KS27_9BACI